MECPRDSREEVQETPVCGWVDEKRFMWHRPFKLHLNCTAYLNFQLHSFSKCLFGNPRYILRTMKSGQTPGFLIASPHGYIPCLFLNMRPFDASSVLTRLLLLNTCHFEHSLSTLDQLSKPVLCTFCKHRNFCVLSVFRAHTVFKHMLFQTCSIFVTH